MALFAFRSGGILCYKKVPSGLIGVLRHILSALRCKLREKNDSKDISMFDISNSQPPKEEGHQADIQPVFCRHETFHPRHGWLKKAYDKCKENPNIFSDDEAPVMLGVGKNMVRALKYWSLAFKLLRENKGCCYPTRFGDLLLSNNGWDPYLENPASLWLLHWGLLSSPCIAATWYFTFNVHKRLNLDVSDVCNSLESWKADIFPSHSVVKESLSKDINCMLRMYTKGTGSFKGEDSIDSPFAALGVIRPTQDHKSYEFVIGKKVGLSNELIVSSCLAFASKKHSKTIAVSTLTYEMGSPGVIYKLSEADICDAIDDVAEKLPGVYLAESAGLAQLAYDKNPHELAEYIISAYYA